MGDTDNNAAATESRVSNDADAQIKSFFAGIKSSQVKWERQMAKVNQTRNYVRGHIEGLDTGVVCDTNVIASNMRAMSPYIYASNQQVTAQPKKWVVPDNPLAEVSRKFALTAELALDDYFVKDAKLKKKMKRGTRSIQVCGIQCLKMTFQQDKYTDPVMESRHNDLQDQIQYMTSNMQQLKEDTDMTDEEAEKMQADLEDQMEAVSQQVEVIRAQGLVIDVVKVDDIAMDPNCDLEEYLQAKWIATRTFIAPREVMRATVSRKKIC